MNILVAGGTGLIGKPLVALLTSKGHSVVTLSRHPQNAAPNKKNNTLHWDATTLGPWAASINDMDAVINLAGENIGSFPWSSRRMKLFKESRLKAGWALMNAIRNASRRPSVFIQASAVGYYGPHGSGEFDENASPGSDFSAKLCIDWEDSTKEAESLGIRRVIVRTGVVMAKQGGVFPLMALPVRLFMGGRLGEGNQGIPWIHLDDEIRAIHFLLEKDSAEGPYNLSAPTPVPNSVFMRTLAETLNRPYWLHVPGWAIRVILGAMSTLLLDGQFMVPRKLLSGGFEFNYSEIGLAFQDLLKR